jgi:hypothetical protein
MERSVLKSFSLGLQALQSAYTAMWKRKHRSKGRLRALYSNPSETEDIQSGNQESQESVTPAKKEKETILKRTSPSQMKTLKVTKQYVSILWWFPFQLASRKHPRTAVKPGLNLHLG